MSTGYLVTGCGRSGTAHIAQVLRHLGVLVKHEEVDVDGLVSWYAGYDVERGLVPHHIKKWQDVRGSFGTIKTFHLVRHPLHCISSSQTHSDGAWKHAAYLLPGIDTLPTVERCMFYWLLWNQECEKHADLRMQVEQVPSRFTTFCEFFDVERDDSALAVPRSTNTRAGQYKPLTWEDLYAENDGLAARVEEQAVRYGYRA